MDEREKPEEVPAADPVKNMRTFFPARLRELLTQTGLTQTDLGIQLGISRQAVGSFLDGSTMPALDTLVKIAALFGVSTDSLLGLDPPGDAFSLGRELTEAMWKAVGMLLALEGYADDNEPLRINIMCLRTDIETLLRMNAERAEAIGHRP